MRELEVGPAAWGWKGQCWTSARIGELVSEPFGVSYTLAGLDLRCNGSAEAPTLTTHRSRTMRQLTAACP